MSNLFLPTDLPGVTFSTTKRPMWSTEVAGGDSGESRRTPLQSRLKWYFKVNYEFLYKAPPGPDELFGFFAAMGGPFQSFLYRDPTDNLQTTSSGTFVPSAADGTTTTAYQISRLISPRYSYVEMLTDGPWTQPFGTDGFAIYVNGVALATNQYSVGATGLVTFVAGAAPAGAVLSWSGNFYYRVHFLGDKDKGMKGVKFQNNYWQHDIEFESVLSGSLPVVANSTSVFIDDVADVDTA